MVHITGVSQKMQEYKNGSVYFATKMPAAKGLTETK